MKNRKSFLTALGISGVTFALAARAEAQPAAAPAITPTPAASQVPSAAASAAASPAKPPSGLARKAAAAMRRFDAKLSDAELETIARGIDDNAAAGRRLNPKKKRLRNGDEPVTAFVVPFS